MSKIQKQMVLSEGLIRAVASGTDQVLVHCVVAGPPGIGKTTTVVRVCEEVRKATGRRHVLAQGSAYALIEALYRLRHGGTVIVDDADALITGGGEKQANFVKQVLLPKRERGIVNMTLEAAKNAERDDPKAAVLPPYFVTQAGVIWLTNNDLAELRHIPPKARPHVKAIKDRLVGRIVNISQEPRDVLDYVLHVCTEGRLLKDRFNLTALESMEVMQYIIETAPYRETLSIRLVEAIAAMRKRSPETWRDMFDTELAEKPIHDMALPEVPFVGSKKQREHHIAMKAASADVLRARLAGVRAETSEEWAAARLQKQEAENRAAWNKERAEPLLRHRQEMRDMRLGIRR